MAAITAFANAPLGVIADIYITDQDNLQFDLLFALRAVYRGNYVP